jgi:hypothetical protein
VIKFMNAIFSRRSKLRALTIVGFMGAACLGAGVGDVLYVSRVSLPIRNGKFAFNKVLITAVQGDQLTVTGVEGSWLKVKYVPKSDDPAHPQPPVEGYVMEDALTARQVTASTAGGPNSATEVASAGATRGLLDSGKYAASKGLNPEPFYKMVTDSRNSMNEKEFGQFVKDGRVGPDKPKPAAGPT